MSVPELNDAQLKTMAEMHRLLSRAREKSHTEEAIAEIVLQTRGTAPAPEKASVPPRREWRE